MKSILYVTLCAALMLGSCVKDEVVIADPDIPVFDYTKLVLNEINGTGGVTASDTEKYIELYNNSSAAVNLAGVQLTYNGAITWTGNSTQVIAPNGYFVVLGTKKSANPNSMMSEGLSAGKNIKIVLLDPEGAIIQSFQRGDGLGGTAPAPIDMDYSRVPNATGNFYFTAAAGTRGVTNGTDNTGLTLVNPI